ncbi:MAG TPA: restriction endonuclease subunit S [Candidatus Agathobaculum pullicola]|nr:restriction endonuclease subunit S [Candidatus Agathobaculum pullicola]
MSWKKVTLGEVSANIQTGPFGSQLHQYDYSETGTPVVMPKDLIGGKISEQSIARVSEDHVQRLNRHIIQKDDILYSRRGDVGRCAFATEHEKGWLCGTGCLRVTTNISRADSKFIFYQLQQPEVVGWVEKHAVGSTMLNLNTAILSNIPLVLPSMNIQHQIADILSAYDDLIENNRKQIKLLEEAAQRLYKQWFVDLRFPGYEHTKIVDGVPEGWEIYRFSDKVDIMSGGTPKTDNPNYYNGTIPFYTPKDSDGAFFAFNTITNITEDGLNNCNSRLYPKNTVIVTARGTVGKTTLLGVPMAMNQSCYALKSDEIAAPYYLFFALNKEIASLKAMSNGGVFNTIIVKTFDSIHIAIPSNDLIATFETLVTPIMEQIQVKTKESFALSEVRDRLLPKLMSGEVEV